MIPDLAIRPLAASQIRAISVAAEVDPRTVERALAGRPIRPLSLARLERVLLARGQLDLLPRDEIELAHREVRVAGAETRAARGLATLFAEIRATRSVEPASEVEATTDGPREDVVHAGTAEPTPAGTEE